jgi:hypothetical protein
MGGTGDTFVVMGMLPGRVFEDRSDGEGKVGDYPVGLPPNQQSL